MTDLDLAAIRERAHSNGLGRNLMNVCNQAIADRRALLDLVDTLTKQLTAVQGLHANHTDSRDHQWCHYCETPWPCLTVQAIEGDLDGGR